MGQCPKVTGNYPMRNGIDVVAGRDAAVLRAI
jgi:hypothetical protein